MKIVKRVIIATILLVVFIALMFFGNLARLFILEKNDEIGLKRIDVKIAGIKDGYIPQGLTFSFKNKAVIQTSYNKKGQVSKLYLGNIITGKSIKELKLKNIDDSEIKGHVGGVTTDDDKLWITSDNKVYRYNLVDIINTTDDFIKPEKEFDLPIKGDFCTYTENAIWIGEYSKKAGAYLLKYPITPIEAPAPQEGEEAPETTETTVEADAKHIDFNKPESIFSLPKNAQGIVPIENKEENKVEFYCDESNTYLSESELVKYVVDLNNKEEVDFKGDKYPYYPYEKAEIIKKVNLPPMAKEMFVSDIQGAKSLFILFESNSDSYKLALPKMEYVMKLKIEKIK